MLTDKRVSVTITQPYIEAMDRLIREGVYISRAEIIKDADKYRLLRQRNKALDGLNLIEQEASAKQLQATRELSVYRYLEDAQRILEEHS